MSLCEVASDFDFSACDLQIRARFVADDMSVQHCGVDDAGQKGRLDSSCTSKAFTTYFALEIADLAIQICRGRGSRRDGFTFTDGSTSPAEKLARGAKLCKIADGQSPILVLVGAAQLRQAAHQ